MEQERRPTTVLFADIRGFTALAEQLDPERVAEALELCLSTMATVIEAHGGYVDKTLGDGIMALFGAPTARTDHAAQAVRAGLSLQRAMEELRPQLVECIGRGLRLRVGISSGTVIAGPMGPPDRRAYTVVGDAVNVASRLQEEAPPGTVLVSDATHRLVATLFRWGKVKALRLKGKRRPVSAYGALGLAALEGATPTHAFVGRSAELAALREAWQRACQGSFQFVTLTGESGVGKARLAAEFAAPLESESSARVLWVHPEGGELQLREGSSGVPPSADTDRDGTGTGSAHDASSFPVVGDVLTEEYLRVPTLLIIEEPRWSLDLALSSLAPLLRKLRRRPLMVLALGSGSGVTRLRRTAAACTTLQLHPLAENEAAELLETVLNGALSDQVRRLVLDRARGLALYIVEIGRWLMETKAVERTNGRWAFRRGGPEPGEVPDSLQGALLARVDRLEEPAKELLRHAAVLGDVFPIDLLEAVARPAEPPDRYLRQLEEAQLFRPARQPGRGRMYAFVHPLIRETIYQSLLRRTAAETHHRAAESLQALPSEQPDDLLKAVAHHYQAAGDSERAARYYLLAAERADRLRAPREAQRLRRAAGQLLGLASVWSLYGGGARPPLRRRFLSAAFQLLVAILLVTPIFAFFAFQPPSPSQVTLGLPAEIMDVTPATLVLPMILGGIPFLATGLLLTHLAVPNYLRARPPFRLQVALVVVGWLLALLAIGLTLAALGVALRFDLLPSVLTHFAGAAIFRLLAADLRFIATILVSTLLISLACNGWLRSEATWRRRQILAIPAEQRDSVWAHPGRVAQQLGLVAVIAALLSALLLLLYLGGGLPGLDASIAAPRPALVAVSSILAILALGGLAVQRWAGRPATGVPSRRLTLGLEVPLVIALLLGALSTFTLRQEVVALSNGLFSPGDMGALNRTAAVFPNLGAISYLRGELHWFQGEESRALADFTRAIELEPSFPASYVGRATILARRGEYGDALADATRLVELRPEHPAGYGLRAAVYFALGDYNQAAADIQLAARPLPQATRGWDAYFVRCVALDTDGQTQEAIADCRRSLELNDRHAGTYEILGRLYYRAGRYREAKDIFDRLLQLVPDDALALANRGAVYRALGQHDRALADLERALSLEPALDVVYQERALTRLALDRPAEAMADVEWAVSINPTLARNHYVRGYVAAYTGDYDLVIASMDRALSLRPDARFFNLRGYAYALQGDHQRALEDLGLALLLDPSDPYTYDSRGFALLRAGRLEQALADLDLALQLLPQSDTSGRAEFLYHQALALEALGQDAAAKSALQEASGFTTLPAVRRQIEGVLQRLGGAP